MQHYRLARRRGPRAIQHSVGTSAVASACPPAVQIEPQPEANRELVTRAVRGDGLLAVAHAADLGVAETVEPAFLNGPAGLDPDALWPLRRPETGAPFCRDRPLGQD